MQADKPHTNAPAMVPLIDFPLRIYRDLNVIPTIAAIGSPRVTNKRPR